MNGKGQVSFEVILLVMVVFVLVLAVAANYFAVHDVTYALTKTKSVMLGEMHRIDKLHILKRIDYLAEGSALTIYVEGDPLFSSAEVAEFNISGLCDEIKNKTGFEPVSVVFGSAAGGGQPNRPGCSTISTI